MQLRHLLLWFPMILLAVANGTLREFVFIRSMSELRAHQLSTVTLILLCSVYVWLVFPSLRLQSARQALFLGLVWVMLTLVFEFTFGRLSGKSWTLLLRDYNLLSGRIWLVFIACLCMLPWIVYAMRR